MNKTLKYLLTILLVSQAFYTQAQQDQLYYTYPFMPLNLNPAYAGSRGMISVSGIYRKRPLFGALGVVATTQQYLNFDMPIAQDKMAIGFQAYNAEQVYGNGSAGLLGNLGLYGDFAYRITMPNGAKLALGLQYGITQVPGFVSSTGGGVGTTGFNSSLGGGIYYNTDDAYLGVSMLNINATDNYYNRPLFITGGYTFRIDDDFKIKAGAVVRKISANFGGKTDFDLNATGWINNKFGIGVWYQNTGSEFSNTAILGSFQVQLKKIQLGYAYDFSGSGNSSTVSSGKEGFHQLMVRYEIDPRAIITAKPSSKGKSSSRY
jgi:type IX secretion system PorP/SprF family membrane protein